MIIIRKNEVEIMRKSSEEILLDLHTELLELKCCLGRWR
jgi:hypothetical protein